MINYAPYNLSVRAGLDGKTSTNELDAQLSWLYFHLSRHSHTYVPVPRQSPTADTGIFGVSLTFVFFRYFSLLPTNTHWLRNFIFQQASTGGKNQKWHASHCCPAAVATTSPTTRAILFHHGQQPCSIYQAQGSNEYHQ